MKLHQRIRRDRAKNTDDWLITYADTITLLLCMFVVILSMKSSGQGLARDRVPQIEHATVSEDIFGRNTGLQATCSADPVERSATETVPEIASIVAERPDVPQPIVSVADIIPQPMEGGAAMAPEMAMPNFALTSLPAIVDRLNTQGDAVVAQHGDRITTIQVASAAFFGSGYAALSETGKSILRDVAVTLKSGDYAAYHVTVEGHTDDTPIKTAQFQSNWELSTARAAAVVRFFLEQGVPAEKLTAAGYADTFPIVPNRNAEGMVIPENQARNRRVLIKLEKIDRDGH